MTFTEVKEIPRGTANRNMLLVKELEEFVLMGIKMAKLTYTPGAYKSVYTCYSTLFKVIKREHFPIKMKIRNNEIYLVRTDM